MAETADARDERSDPAAPFAPEDTLYPVFDPALFTPDEQAHLLALRERIEQGRVGELTGDYKWLMFARWMYQQGKIEG